MSLGSANQTNRIGHGVASTGGIAVGQVIINAGAEVSLGTFLAGVYSASGVASFAPFEVRLEALSSGLELRSKTGVSGYAIQHVPGGGAAHGAPLVLYLNQNSTSPNSLIIANTSAGNIALSAMLLG